MKRDQKDQRNDIKIHICYYQPQRCSLNFTNKEIKSYSYLIMEAIASGFKDILQSNQDSNLTSLEKYLPLCDSDHISEFKQWCFESKDNLNFCIRLAEKVLKQYYVRFRKVHGLYNSLRTILYNQKYIMPYIKSNEFTLPYFSYIDNSSEYVLYNHRNSSFIHNVNYKFSRNEKVPDHHKSLKHKLHTKDQQIEMFSKNLHNVIKLKKILIK